MQVNIPYIDPIGAPVPFFEPSFLPGSIGSAGKAKVAAEAGSDKGSARAASSLRSTRNRNQRKNQQFCLTKWYQMASHFWPRR